MAAVRLIRTRRLFVFDRPCLPDPGFLTGQRAAAHSPSQVRYWPKVEQPGSGADEAVEGNGHHFLGTAAEVRHSRRRWMRTPARRSGPARPENTGRRSHRPGAPGDDGPRLSVRRGSADGRGRSSSPPPCRSRESGTPVANNPLRARRPRSWFPSTTSSSRRAGQPLVEPADVIAGAIAEARRLDQVARHDQTSHRPRPGREPAAPAFHRVSGR